MYTNKYKIILTHRTRVVTGVNSVSRDTEMITFAFTASETSAAWVAFGITVWFLYNAHYYSCFTDCTERRIRNNTQSKVRYICAGVT